MPNPVLWDDLQTFSLAIAGDASSPTLKNLASAARILGDAIDPTSSKFTLGLWQLRTRGASAYGAGQRIEVYFLLSADGTNYEDGDTSTTPSSRTPDLIFTVRAVSTQQIITLKNIWTPPCKFKPLLINTADQAFTNTNDENQLHYRFYGEEIN